MKKQHITEFNQRYPLYEQLMNEARFILESSIEKEEIKTHAILGRVKDVASFEIKAERLESKKPFDDVTDLVGLRIICLLRTDILRIGDIIRASFSVISEDNKIDGQEISSFGYQSVHFIVTMKNEYTGPRYDPIKDLVLEIQVRTVAMDAWATVSHYLDYKSDHDVPQHMRKDFYALSGLFYVVDTHFELFYQAGNENRSATLERISNEDSIEGEELNIDTFRAYIGRKITDHEIPSDDADGYSTLIGELSSSGYKYIAEIDSVIDRGWEAFLEYEKNNPPHSTDNLKFNAIGVVRGLMSIVDDNYYLNRREKTELNSYNEFKYLVLPE